MTETKLNPSLLEAKPHFEILDGLRGVAAIAVVIFHFMEIAVPDYKNNFIARSYLAVDFFFCLSGFVISYAYDSKIEKIGIAQFFKLRLIRLHPLVVIGSVIGLLAFVFDPFSSLSEKYGVVKVFLMFITSCFLIPYPIVPERYFNLFHLNPPTWSLFWEYVANIIYALIIVRLGKRMLWILTGIAAGLLCYESYRSGYLGVGWSGDNITGGGIRVFYSFFGGILVFRSGRIIKSKLSFPVIGILLFIVFLIPYSDKTNRIIDPLVVIFYLPFLISLGAGTGINSGKSKLCKFLGDISYPLYMTHYPFIWIFYSYVEKQKPSIQEMIIVMTAGLILLIGLAYLVMIVLDIPIRKYFKNRMKKEIA